MSPNCNQLLLMFCCVYLFLGLTFASNVDMRKFIRIKPSKTDDNAIYHFGAAVELKSSGGNPVLYVGAPSATDASGKSGLVFACGVNVPTEDKSESTCSTSFTFERNGALGMSMELDETEENLIVCGNQYAFTCGTKKQAQQYMIGSCYKRRLIDATSNLMITPCVQNCFMLLTADIMFALDESGSVDANEFNTQLTWVVGLLRFFRDNIEVGYIRVGVVLFNSNSRNPIELNKYTFSKLEASIRRLSRRRGGTNIETAIRESLTAFKTNGRPEVSQIMIVLTDGQSTGDVPGAANDARTRNIVTCAIGVGGGANTQTLLQIAGNESRIFKAENFANLNRITKELVGVIQLSATVLEGESANTTNELTQCQAGSSSYISKEGDVYVGATGASDRSGSVIDFIKENSKISTTSSQYLSETDLTKLINPTTLYDFKESYLGYSVTTGRFMGDGVELVASGAPRYKSKGAVFMYDSSKPINASSAAADTLHPRIDQDMWQLGAYFGHSVCSANLNGDEFEDLLVSSPLFAEDMSSYDQGRVFVFVNNPLQPGIKGWVSGSFQPQILKGSNANGARFGMSIVVGGDIDRNGYDDIIIGAPGEEASNSGSGAVYIYFAVEDGISDSNKQRILGRSVAENLRGFGVGLFQSSGNANDIDGNQYPEVVVSAPSSDDVVVLFSQPSVNVTASIVTDPSTVDVVQCFSRINEICTSFTFCISAQQTAAEATDKFDMMFDIELDPLVTDHASKRMFFQGKSSYLKSFTRQIGAIERCMTYDLLLNANAFTNEVVDQGFDVPLKVQILYDFSQAHKNKTLSGVFNSLSRKLSATAEWTFLTGCSGENGSCSYDLQTSANIVFPASQFASEDTSQPYLFGKTPGVLGINITVTNGGQEYALFAGVNISSGPLVLSQAIGRCSNIISSLQGISELSFRVSNSSTLRGYMLPGQSCNFLLQYPLHVLTDTAAIRNISISGNAFSNAGQSFGRDVNPNNNDFLFSRQFLYTARLQISLYVDQSSIFFNYTTSPSFASTLMDDVLGGTQTDISHTFNIYNTGNQMLSAATMEYSWPAFLSKNKSAPLLYLYELECLPTTMCQCNVTGKVNPMKLSSDNQSRSNVSLFFPPPDQVQLGRTTNCSSVYCEVIQCRINQLRPFASIRLKGKFKVWIPTLSQLNLNTEMSTFVRVDTSESPLRGPFIFQLTASTRVSSDVVAEDLPVNDGIDLAIVLAATGGAFGVMLLSLLIMYKVGFFNSKYAKMMKEARNDEGASEESVAKDE